MMAEVYPNLGQHFYRRIEKHHRGGQADLGNHDELEITLQTLAELIKDGRTTAQDLEGHMQSARTLASQLKQACIERLPPKFVNERCPKHALALAQRVFDIPELLEMILGQLNIREMLTAQRVNKQFRDTVESSVTLQRTLSLRRDSNSGYLRAPFRYGELPGLCAGISFKDTQAYPHRTIAASSVNIEVTLGNSKYATMLPNNVGSRVRAMFICQPPPKQITIRPSCCHPIYPRRNATIAPKIETVQNDQGLTIGDLYDAAMKVFKEHRHCPHASLYDHDEQTGEVKVDLLFVATVEVDEGDPILSEKRRHITRITEGDTKRAAWYTLIQQYTTAKQTAEANATAIPSLEEFKAGQGAFSA